MLRDKIDAAPPDGFLAGAASKGSSPLWDILTIAVVVVPMLGTFFPLEQYLAGGEGGASFASAPSSGATMSTYVVAVSLLVLALYFVSGRSFPILRRLG